jgi:hypothetical protein
MLETGLLLLFGAFRTLGDPLVVAAVGPPVDGGRYNSRSGFPEPIWKGKEKRKDNKLEKYIKDNMAQYVDIVLVNLF